MLAYTYIEKGKFALLEKPMPVLRDDRDAIVTHTYPLREIEAAYDLFENRRDGVIKVAVEP